MRTFSLKKPTDLNEPTAEPTAPVETPEPVIEQKEQAPIEPDLQLEDSAQKEIDRINNLPPTQPPTQQVVELSVKLNDTGTAIRLSYDPEGKHYVDLPRHQAIRLMQLLGRLATKLGYRVEAKNKVGLPNEK
jgi:hypothetical protein